MTTSCCDSSKNGSEPFEIDQTNAVEARYGAAANQQETCLCTPVAFDQRLLQAIPSDVVKKDYGCGDPTRWIQAKDKVLDLGSGSGKNAFICAQVVGKLGSVIGIDRNLEMLKLARDAAPLVAQRIGFSNVRFLEGSIEALNEPQADNSPLVAKGSVDIVLSNCVLNLVNPSKRHALLCNIKRVLTPNGRVAISDIVSDRPIPLSLQKDPELWSGCISGAWQEDNFLKDFQSIGFQNVHYVDRSESPWEVIEDIEFRAVTLVGHL